MKRYELNYLISPDLTNEEAKSLSEKIVGFVNELSGVVENNPDPERRSLAYLIEKKKESYLTSLDFSLAPEKVKDLEKKIKTEKQILRHLITSKKKAKKAKKERTKESKEKKVGIEKISEKIDEILQNEPQ